jgi:dipeptidase
MQKQVVSLWTVLCLMTLLGTTSAQACTNLLVTKGASADGSVMITYTCDGEFVPHMEYFPAADYPPDDSLEIKDWHDTVRGKIKQVPHTYAVVDLMNEPQLVIGETTFSGRQELRNPDGLLHYWDLIELALKRAKTAREAITVIVDLMEEYGYRSTGESISIADTEEAWILEIIGPGERGHGAQWVAVKIPDGYISAHANKARIGEFPLDDPQNCLYSDNDNSFAVEKGYYDPNSGEPFRFNEAYCPPTPKNQRYAAARVWSMFRRAAPSLNLSPDYHRAVEGAQPYPLWIKPDKKLSLADVFSLMRDHYEDTDFDMTQGIDAGPFGLPYRWRPMYFTIDSIEYAWERPISTQQTGFSFVSQSRSWLPDPIGGVLWYGVDDTYVTCYFPLYCGINAIPQSFTVGKLSEFSWDSAWWVFNFAANFSNLKFSLMIQDLQAVQSELEGSFIALQPAVEKTALELLNSNPDLMTRYLTDYSVSHAEMVVDRWKELGEHLITKYNDGYVKDEEGRPRGDGYPERWLQEVVKVRPNQFLLPVKKEPVPESQLVD